MEEQPQPPKEIKIPDTFTDFLWEMFLSPVYSPTDEHEEEVKIEPGPEVPYGDNQQEETNEGQIDEDIKNIENKEEKDEIKENINVIQPPHQEGYIWSTISTLASYLISPDAESASPVSASSTVETQPTETEERKEEEFKEQVNVEEEQSFDIKYPDNYQPLLSLREFSKILKSIPLRFQFSPISLLYTEEEGISIHHFYDLIGESSANILIVKTTENVILGGFAVEKFYKRKGYYGNGECFLFERKIKQENDEDETIYIYKATLENDYFLFCDDKFLAFGGGDGKFSLHTDLVKVSCDDTPTFEKWSNGKQEAYIERLEVWGICD